MQLQVVISLAFVEFDQLAEPGNWGLAFLFAPWKL